jgi:hypothetical protein
MTLLDTLKGALAQYSAGNLSTEDAEHHFQQVAQSTDHATLAQGISDAIRSDQTPPFAQLVGQLFGNATPEQKASMLSALLAAAPATLRSQLSALIPGAAGGTSVAPAQAGAVSTSAVSSIAEKVEQHNPAVVDQMSALYAQHPTLVKTLGTAAMMIALRSIASRRQ